MTLTVTTDPALMAVAPPLETFADPVAPDPARPAPEVAPVPAPRPAVEDDGSFVSALDEIFAHQEELRMARRRIPQQRSSG